MNRFFKQLVIFCSLVLVVQIIISMEWKIERNLETGNAEALRIGLPVPYVPGVEILSIQEHQVEHPELGFIWKPSITLEDNVIVGWGDIPAGAISTDDIGFANSEDAISMRQEKEPIDIIGIGASYMGGGSNLFHEYFALNGYSYYSMAHGRFTLPQFNVVLKEYALAEKPKWVVYGLNEVSFTLIPDYELWHESGMGWFDFHSGTWCGPTPKKGFPHDQLKPFPRAYRIYQSVMKKTLRGAFDKKPTRKELVDKTLYYIFDAYQACKENGTGFILLLIPGKERMIHGPMPSLYLFEEVLPHLEKNGVPYIDLRHSFAQAENPSMLYFQKDSHWNNNGIYRAAREIVAFIEHSEQQFAGK